ncbi:MAG TPA: HAD family hydrolase [Thermoflexales bacterium]|nr:HAD family hydrolase [Thermoflexales bacterium]HQW35300.1 HAD family hydrolase [Thermoflexales bacterium]HQZ22022.1 HAD family hydrolase [Thermoflexales bacterium]HRA00033.1 HAD family hydrolase [Thermoflexales bacterium]
MSFDPARVRAICFDLDGTLNDADDAMVDRLARWLPGHDHKLARRIVIGIETPATWGFILLDRVGLSKPMMGLLNEYYRSRMNRKTTSYSAVPNTMDAVRALAPHYKLAIVSSRWEATTLYFLDEHHIRSHFSCIATALTCKHTKPYPDPVLWVASQMGLRPDECIMVGDTTVDMLAGKAAGAQCVGVLCGFGTKGELLHAGADVILSSTADIPELLGLGSAKNHMESEG